MLTTQVDFLSVEECDRIRDDIQELRSFWIHRGSAPHLPYYSLGMGTYLDAKQIAKTYYSQAPFYNQILKNKFEPLYEKLLKVLETALGVPTFYDDQLALPGFHIFLGCESFEMSIAPIHWDLQQHYLNWDGKDVSFENPVSFTASIRLPKWGGGLNVWDLSFQEMNKMSPEECDVFFKKGPDHFIEYHTGKMVIHSGEIIHQIAPMKNASETDERITLQGHGIRSRDGYLLYW